MNMKEKRIILFTVIAVIIATLLYVVFAYTEHADHDPNHNHDAGRIDIEQAITDEEHGYVTECAFTYELYHEGDHEIDIIVNDQTKIIVESMESDNPCYMTLSKGGNVIWNEQMVAGKEMGPGIEAGEYKLLLEFSDGKGKGKVIIDDGEEHAHLEDHDHEHDHDHDHL